MFGGKVGSFPKVYVKDTSVKIEPGGGTTRVKASFAHEATEESGELSFPKDAVMFVVAKVSETHWKGVWDGKVRSPKKTQTNLEHARRCVQWQTLGVPHQPSDVHSFAGAPAAHSA